MNYFIFKGKRFFNIKIKKTANFVDIKGDVILIETIKFNELDAIIIDTIDFHIPGIGTFKIGVATKNVEKADNKNSDVRVDFIYLDGEVFYNERFYKLKNKIFEYQKPAFLPPKAAAIEKILSKRRKNGNVK
jgi:hypothetical protein